MESVSLPEFKSEDEERKFWAEHDSSEFVDWSKARRVPEPQAVHKDDLAAVARIDA